MAYRSELAGRFYLIFSWTGIPCFIALIEFVIYAATSSDRLQEKYSARGDGVVIAIIAGGVGFIFLVGILAAIAIPQFAAYRNRANQVAVETTLMNLQASQAAHFVEHNRYASDLNALDFDASMPNVTVE